ncbi:unnamed protein product [Fusarium graminearum]|uniref:Chromosome 4, complete genome n=1 Tax=Gibberella zeae (strain ATCC MYA-4620 / CBS 123657 / FGSC 9075 / NRRL 31084 / PH-1) TaxID=229533 RepID=A0A0E0SG00_GIBZE|nr:hypothetical protein FG05_30474 [Fusarium graminearum]CEF85363.1 unnamed protein product [Fusarium graminearum]
MPSMGEVNIAVKLAYSWPTVITRETRPVMPEQSIFGPQAVVTKRLLGDVKIAVKRGGRLRIVTSIFKNRPSSGRSA